MTRLFDEDVKARLLLSAVLLWSVTLPVLAEPVIYRIKTQAEDGGYYQSDILLYGEKVGGKSGNWILLKGDRKGTEEYEYVVEDIGSINLIGIQLRNQVEKMRGQKA